MNRYIVPTFFVIVAVSIYIFFIDVTVEKIKGLLAREKEIGELIADAQKIEAQLIELNKAKSSLHPDYESVLATILPPKIDPLRLIIDIDGLAKERGLSIIGPQVSRASDVKKGGEFSRTLINFSVQAPYVVFKEFLHDLESSLALRDVTTLSFSTAVQATGPATNTKNPELAPHQYTVSVVTYSQKNSL